MASGIRAFVLGTVLSVAAAAAYGDLDIGVLIEQQRATATVNVVSTEFSAGIDAETGTVDGIFGRAKRLDHSNATQSQLAQAAALYRVAAEGGHGRAQSALGLMYAQGQGVV